MLKGIAVARKKSIGFHLSSCLPNQTREALPKICPIVRMGTAALMPTILVRTGSNINAPPKPAAPEIVAAMKLIANKIIGSVVNF